MDIRGSSSHVFFTGLAERTLAQCKPETKTMKDVLEGDGIRRWRGGEVGRSSGELLWINPKPPRPNHPHLTP